MDENDTIMKLIEEVKDFIIDNSGEDEEKALELLKRLNSYKYFLLL